MFLSVFDLQCRGHENNIVDIGIVGLKAVYFSSDFCVVSLKVCLYLYSSIINFYHPKQSL